MEVSTENKGWVINSSSPTEDRMPLHGDEIRDIITKYYYKDNYLHFQILLLLAKNNATLIYQEYNDYTAYKRTLEELQLKKNANQLIEFPKNDFINRPEIEKMA